MTCNSRWSFSFVLVQQFNKFYLEKWMCRVEIFYSSACVLVCVCVCVCVPSSTREDDSGLQHIHLTIRPSHHSRTHLGHRTKPWFFLPREPSLSLSLSLSHTSQSLPLLAALECKIVAIINNFISYELSYSWSVKLHFVSKCKL